MRTFRFEPAFYEWHLVDVDTEEVLHCTDDPAEEMCEYNTIEELESASMDALFEADSFYENGLDYDGVFLEDDKRLSVDEIYAAAKVMAEALYNYYIK